jgi:hypothetical protein
MKQNIPKTLILTLSYLAATTLAQVTSVETKNFASTYGVGSGVVIIFIFIFIGMCVCCLGKATAVPMYLAIVGTLLPIIVFLIIYYLPKEVDRPSTSEEDVETDWRPVFFFLFWVLILLFALVALMWLMVIYCCRMNRAYSLDSGSASITAAFIDNKEKEDDKVYRRDRTKYLTKP